MANETTIRSESSSASNMSQESGFTLEVGDNAGGISTQRHQLDNAECEKKQYQCQLCAMLFTSQAGLSSHTCVGLDKSYCDESISVSTHQSTHGVKMTSGMIRPNQHQYNYSGKQLSHQKRMHRVNSTPEQYFFKCKYCSDYLANKHTFRQHLKSHERERLQAIHRCKFCPKVCLMESQLLCHMRIHTTQKPFKCTLCHKQFSDHLQLVTHHKTHADEKPLQ
uniref:Zinc finger protein 317-like n=1 Tax=Saccoglossus kowalevskii TaxID=10224 RepID=A0ABM0MXM8_SACKO|nr:PREDICTED: zinc finger protein 317-like [Saccoglossus kowalevskii]